MEGVSETVFFTWIGVLVGPAVAYGIWMQIKMMGSEEGKRFLYDRQNVSYKAERPHKLHDKELGATIGKVAKLSVGLDAAKGAYGDEVSSMIGDAWVFFKYYAVYAVVVVAAMFYFL